MYESEASIPRVACFMPTRICLLEANVVKICLLHNNSMKEMETMTSIGIIIKQNLWARMMSMSVHN